MLAIGDLVKPSKKMLHDLDRLSGRLGKSSVCKNYIGLIVNIKNTKRSPPAISGGYVREGQLTVTIWWTVYFFDYLSVEDVVCINSSSEMV
jgi:hypothetical protein